MTTADFTSISFGVCFKINNELIHYKIPIDNSVRESLVEMRNSFIESYDSIPEELEEFSPTEKYASVEKLYANLNKDYLISIKDLFHHQNSPVNNIDLSKYLLFVEYYFAEFIHINLAKTIGVKRPNQFKALLQKKIVRLFNDTLEAVSDDIFKLDNDFDFLIHDASVEILHPSGFVFISDLDQQILTHVNETVSYLNQNIPFLNFNSIGDFIINKGARRAAKLLASIKSRNDLQLIDIQKLQTKCQLLGFHLSEDGNGKYITEDERIVELLEILDRRSYDYDLNTDNVVEIYIASSRRKKK